MGRASKTSNNSNEKQSVPEGSATIINNSDIQSWCEVPSIAHFCSLFRQAFDLLEFDIQELEESLLLMGTEDDTSQLVLRLLIRLLKGCSRTFMSNINEENYNTYLRRLFLSKREEAEEDGMNYVCEFECKALLDDDIDFADLSLRNRVRILQQLTEYRLDADDVLEKVKNLEASSLRVDPLGKDSDNVVFWYFYGTRLYKEEAPNKNDEHYKKRKEKERKKKKKDRKKKKKHKKSRRESISSDEEVPNSKWSVACLTQKDWEDLTEKYKKSKKKSEKELYETLNDNFLPEIVKMFAEREREEKRKLMMMAPKRASNRIERKRQDQEERDRLMAEKLEEERRLEEEYDEKVREERLKREEEEREMAREERIKQRDAMKELRAKRIIERDFSTDAIAERQEQKTNAACNRAHRAKEREKNLYSDIYNPFTGGDDSEEEEKDITYKPTQSELRSNDREDSKDNHLLNKEKKPNIANALLKVGTKSIKDVSLDKPVRKSPGLLLESAGRSLLQRRNVPGDSDISTSNGNGQGLSFGLCSSKISFGLYGGHLDIGQPGTNPSNTNSNNSVPSSIDDSHSEKPRMDEESTKHNGKNGNKGSFSHSSAISDEVSNPTRNIGFTNLSNKDSSSSTAKISITSPLSKFGQLSGTKIVIGNSNSESQNTQNSSQTKKAFSNWGGEFFKKNLDYRANTNKILEKMNLTNSVPSPNSSSISNSSGTNQYKKETPLSPTSSNGGEHFKTMFTSPVNRKRPLDISPNQNSNISKNESPAKQLKGTSGASIYNSYNM